MIDLSLLQDFITEATDHLEEMESNLLLLEKDPENREVLNEIFRSIHTIKGASMFVGLPRISELSHKMENLLDLLRQGQKRFNSAIGDTLIEGRDRLYALIHELEKNQEEASEIDDLLEQILALSATDPSPAAPAPAPPAEKESAAATVTGSTTEFLDDSILGEDIDQSILGEDTDDSILGEDLDLSLLEGSFPKEDTTASLSEALTAALNQAEPSPAAPFWPTTPAVEPEDDDNAIRLEIAGEANDDELFGIFTQQFAGNLERLGSLIVKGTTRENLATTGECLGTMRSSANYMGYRNLTTLLDNCLVTVAPDRPDFAALTNYRERLLNIFENFQKSPEPRAGTPAVAAKESAQAPTAPSIATDEDESQIREQISEEIYDAELYKIFQRQLEDNYRQLTGMLASAITTDRTRQALTASRELLVNLKYSANYMGYSHLVNFYEQWLLEVQTTASFMDQGGRGDLVFMGDRLERLRHIFPMLPEKVEPDTLPEENKLGSAPPKAVATAAKAPADKAKPATEVSTEDDLFMTLSSSVDAALANTRTSELTPLHDILEEMLFAEPEQKQLPAGKGAAMPGQTAPAPKPPEPEAEEESEEEIEERRQDNRRQEEDRRDFDRRLSERRQPDDKGDRILKHSIRVDSQKIDALMNQVGELVVSRAYFTQIFNDLRNLQQELKENIGFDSRGLKPIREVTFKLGEATQALSRVSNELQEGVMKIRMLPVSQLFNRYPRLVRDLVKKTDKKIDLNIKGEDTELDKMVIEEISDPMIHIIRNAVDHGLESTQDRLAAGKPEFGTLTLEAFHESNHIVIEVTDDGRGIDIDKIKAKAVARGLLNAGEAARISDTEARRFIMMPGFSTADKATETSGRGVGMDVIKTNIERLNGTVEVESQFGSYTRIRIKIPLTLAIIQALMIRVGVEIFTIPLSVVEETLRIHEHDTSLIEGVEVIHLRDTTMPIFRLSEMFRIPGAHPDISQSFVVIVTTGMQQIGLVVDELIGQEEVVIKPLVDYLRDDSGFSGATIIGDGRISLILDIYELVKMTSERQADRYREQTRNRKIKAGHPGTRLPAAKTTNTEAALDTTIN
jgi:two-component system chemotaxis sensor kinase CheA